MKEFFNQIPRWLLLTILTLGLILCFVPLIIIQWDFGYDLGTFKSNEIGDAIGGITAPFIGFLGVVLTFFAFWVQYQYNLHQREDIKIERFENKFYELLRQHNANVDEMHINAEETVVSNRKCFVQMFYEYKFILLVCLNEWQNNYKEKYSEDEILNIAYIIFFNGIGDNSDDSINYFLKEYNDINEEVIKNLQKAQAIYLGRIGGPILIRLNYKGKPINFKLEIDYFPFDGHVHRLGHYYRQLFQTVKYVVNTEVFNNTLREGNDIKQKKLEYIRILRAQLSNHEQLLLYFNSFSNYGKAWIDNHYFTEYYMVHNLPLALIRFSIDDNNILSDEKHLNKVVVDKDILYINKLDNKPIFEWQEKQVLDYLDNK